MGWLIALGIFTLLAVLPIGVDVCYDAAGTAVDARLGPVKLQLVPGRKKNKEKPEKKKAADAQGQREEPPLPEPPQPPKASEPEKDIGKKGGSVLDFLPLLKVALDFLGDFRRKLRVELLELRLTLAGGDPCDLALNYAKAWAAVGNLLPQLERIFVIQDRQVEVQCDFQSDKTTIYARLKISITFGRLLWLAVIYGLRAAKEYFNLQKKRKGGASV